MKANSTPENPESSSKGGEDPEWPASDAQSSRIREDQTLQFIGLPNIVLQVQLSFAGTAGGPQPGHAAPRLGIAQIRVDSKAAPPPHTSGVIGRKPRGGLGVRT